MKIKTDKNLVEFTPENQEETDSLVTLWRTVVDCVRFNKKLVPIGEFIPGQTDFARFAIEGMDSASLNDGFPEIYVEEECRCYCQTCNKYVELKKGDRIPPCCGKLMEILD